MHDMKSRHRFASRQPCPDSGVVHVGVPRVLLGQHRFVRMVDREQNRQMSESRERDADDVVEMQDVDILQRVPYGPCGVVEILQLGSDRILDRPVGVRIPPFDAAGQPRIAIRVHSHVVPACVEAACEVCDE